MSQTKDNKPDWGVFHVRDRGDDKSAIWTELGVGWNHSDGKGLSIELNAQPTDGRLTIRAIVDRNLAEVEQTPIEKRTRGRRRDRSQTR